MLTAMHSAHLRSWTRLGRALALVVAMAAPAQAADAPAAMIIFDGSGSMWGRLEGEKKSAKLDLARDALRAALQKLPAGAKTGLMSFGHRRAGDCSDIEVIAPVAEGEAGRIMTPLDKLNPRGKGPITGALRDAAKALAGMTPASIVLIHDNADNCRADPCEAASEIAASAPKIKVHLLALGLEREELARVACIPKLTGGMLFDIKDQAALAGAFTQAIGLAYLNQGGPAATAAPETLASTPATAANPAGPPGLKLSARLAPNSAALALPIQWRVFKAGNPAPVFAATGSTVTAPLDVGAYTVEARAGFATATRPVEVAAQGPTPLDVSMEAAALRVIVRDAADAAPAAGALVTLTQLTPAGGTAPPARPLWIGPAGDADFVLPAGTYKVRSSESLAAREETLVLAAGTILDQDVITGAGRLELTAVTKPDGDPLDGVTFLISKDDPEAPDGRREIARSASQRAAFVLPSGTYYVTARLGAIDVRQRAGISAGDVVKRAVVMGLAKLTVGAEFASAKKDTNLKDSSPGPLKWPLSVRILSLEGEPREVARATALTPEFTVAAGRYRVEAAIGALNIKTTQEIDVEAGAARRLTVKLDAAPVSLRYQPPAAAASTDLMWDVRDGAGALVVRSAQANPKLMLAPGHYLVRLDTGGERLEKSLDLPADGFSKAVELSLP